MLLLVPLLVLGWSRPAMAAKVWHVVAPGETLRSIARTYGVSVTDLVRWNQITAAYPVQVDATLRLTPPARPLPDWATRVEPVTPGMVNWNARQGCPVAPAHLRRVWVRYIDLQGNAHNGSVIVRRDVVTRVQRIFRTLYHWRFRIMAMAPMSVNMPGWKDMGIVTAGYRCRPVAGTRIWSQHAYGTALDINPLQNPMLPAPSSVYANRSRHLIGMIHAGGAARAFTWNGYFWGGNWRSAKDYMHFSLTNK
ncbi:hypothetical protein Ari01nite_63650 [Paractinoplanes rishiriensis]|uniref:LysM domain-containing protein n=1 Tax=Paractinoplanes rishiriensis TaxID=1050105 RepID=A0A919MZX9_9ACTN|nr:hypothetical protein Ari01nite_63650 [Actinoplanes rishiriensis]